MSKDGWEHEQYHLAACHWIFHRDDWHLDDDSHILIPIVLMHVFGDGESLMSLTSEHLEVEFFLVGVRRWK